MNFAVSTSKRRCLRCLIIALCLALLTAGSAAADSVLLPIKLIAHRGLTSAAPENSLAALQAAWQAGLHGAEIDVRTTRDAKLVLMHDATLERTSNGQGLVRQNSWPDLQQLRLKNPQGRPGQDRIPSLEQALAWLQKRSGFRLALDLKEADPKAVGRLVLKYGLAPRVDLYVGGPERAGLIRVIKDFNPALRVSLNLGWWWRVEGVPAFAAQGTGADALFAAEWNFPSRGFAEARQAGAEVQVYVWGSKDLAGRLRKAAAAGAQVFSCDHPLQLLPLVEPRKVTD